MSTDPAQVILVPPLLQAYKDDVTLWAVNAFKEKHVDLKHLKRWQKKYKIYYPWNPEYHIERLGYNRINQVYPLMIIMCKHKKDIQWAIRKALELKIKFSIKNGGHDHTGASVCDGIIINVSERNEIRLDPSHKYVSVGCGVTLGKLDLKLTENDCCWVPHGTCANVSTIGLSISAGIGALTRKYGLTIDHLIDATVVLADGSIVKANENVNQDLFWMLRGCGASTVGVVTDIRLKIHRSQSVVLYEIKYKLDQLAHILKLWDKFGPYATNDLASKILFFPQSCIDMDFHVCLKGQFEGSVSDLNDLLKDFIAIAHCVNIWTATPIDAAIFYNKGTVEPPWYFNYETLFTVDLMGDATIQALCDFASTAGPECAIVLNALGGKMAEVASDESAFPWRDAKMWIHIMSETRDQKQYAQMERDVKLVYNNLLDSGLRNSETGVGRLYSNFKDLSLTNKQYPLAYWGPNYPRIKEIKQKYDPDNVFKSLHGIPM